MSESEGTCPFCDVPSDGIIAENELALTLFDGFPASPGHVLVCPRRHVESFFDLTAAEVAAVFELLRQARDHCHARFVPDGYNVGINIGPVAGQTVTHAHVHLIPRYAGDVLNPTGGVRNVIPGKGPYAGGRHLRSDAPT